MNVPGETSQISIPVLMSVQQRRMHPEEATNSSSLGVVILRDDDSSHGAPSDCVVAIPFTYRFLGLRLRLAFTKRRFRRVEASYLDHMTSRLRRSVASEEATTLLAGLDGELDSSFKTLRQEIDRIEEAQETMRLRALPKVEQLIILHKGFNSFLHGFLRRGVDDSAECHLPMLNLGSESTTAVKRIIADFAGVPTGMLLHDLRSLEVLLRQESLAEGSAMFRHAGKAVAPDLTR